MYTFLGCHFSSRWRQFSPTPKKEQPCETRQLSTNSVSTAKIQDSAITTAKIADNNVTDAKVGNRTIGDPGQEQLPTGNQTYNLSNWITKLWAWIKYVNSRAGVVSANPTARISVQNSGGADATQGNVYFDIKSKSVGTGYITDGAATDAILANRSVNKPAAGTDADLTVANKNYSLTNWLSNIWSLLLRLKEWGDYLESGKATNTALNTHTGNSDIHVTAANKTTWNGKENAITAGTTAQYWRGDKSWQTFPTTWDWANITSKPSIPTYGTESITFYSSEPTSGMKKGDILYTT